MTNLREETLIFKGVFWFLLPSICIGVLGVFFPAVYSIIPVHETDTCLCYFFKQVFDHNRKYLFLDQQSSYLNYRLMNSVAFFVTNWTFLMLLTWMIYRIRHIQDETLIKNECAWVVGIWISLSVCQYILFLVYTSAECDLLNDQTRPDNNYYQFSYQMTYWVIIARDSMTTLTTAFYCLKVKQDFKKNPQIT